jgi:hypothetical protein
MASQTTSPGEITRLAAGCIVVSSLAALIFLFFGHVANVRAASGGVGIIAAFFGTGITLWFSWRARNRRIVLAALISLLPLVFWCWVIYQIVHGR